MLILSARGVANVSKGRCAPTRNIMDSNSCVARIGRRGVRKGGRLVSLIRRLSKRGILLAIEHRGAVLRGGLAPIRVSGKGCHLKV